MKKILVSLLTLSVFSSSPVVADERYDNCNTQECCWGTFTVGGDWLYWRTDETKLDYGSEISGIVEGNNQVITAKVIKPKFKHESGYRVFANYETCDQLWKISAIFTHAPSNAKNNLNTMSMANMDFITIFNANFPILSAISQTPLNTISSKWNNSVNYLDLDISRSFALCDNLQIVPHIGLRGLWQNQTFKIFGNSDTLAFNTKLKGHIHSIGLEGGLKAAWRIFQGLSLIGDVGGSILYSQSHNKGTLNAFSSEGDSSSVDISYKNKFRKGLPMFDCFVGIQYAASVWDYSFEAHVGWEQHVIFETNDFSLSGAGNMTLHGLTLGGSIAF